MGLRLWGDRHHQVAKVHRTGGRLLLARVAKLLAMHGTQGQEAYLQATAQFEAVGRLHLSVG
jgi:hypothetical protein